MSVHEKILEIMKKVEYMKKDDKVEFGNTKYKALSEEKVTGIMRQQLIEQGLVVYPIDMQWNRQGSLSHVDVKYRIADAENPKDYVEVVSCGDGADSQDKGSGKAMTYAFKYMFLRTFAIPTGEDPDKISSEQIEAELAEAEKKKADEEKNKALVTDIGDMKIAPVKVNVLKGDIDSGLMNEEKMLAYFKVEKLEDVTEKQFSDYVQKRNKAGAEKAKK